MKTYIPDNDPRLVSVREQIRMEFEVGNLYSTAKPYEILNVAMQALVDAGLPPRRSLAMMVGRQAQVAWLAEIDRTKAALA